MPFLGELVGRYAKTLKSFIRYCTEIFVSSLFLLGVFKYSTYSSSTAFFLSLIIFLILMQNKKLHVMKYNLEIQYIKVVHQQA